LQNLQEGRVFSIEGIAHVTESIYDLANLTPEYCRTERDRCTYLQKAIDSEDVATSGLSRVHMSECIFDEMY
jgi:hypothetical protein